MGFAAGCSCKQERCAWLLMRHGSCALSEAALSEALHVITETETDCVQQDCKPGSRQQATASQLNQGHASPFQVMAFISTRSNTPSKLSSEPMGICRQTRP